jgi:Bacterial regulatory helix-turn-helix protein, lysR family
MVNWVEIDGKTKMRQGTLKPKRFHSLSTAVTLQVAPLVGAAARRTSDAPPSRCSRLCISTEKLQPLILIDGAAFCGSWSCLGRLDAGCGAGYDQRMEWEPDVAGSPELDLRRLRYFVAVAQELHFGRAAGRLFVAQPVVTRQIRRLEEELGVSLFTRTTRDVQLTPAGEQLLSDARPLLAAADAAKRRVRRAEAGPSALTVGFFVGDPVGRALRTFSESHADVTVDLVRIWWGYVLSEGAWSIPQTLSPSSEPATDAVCDLPRAPHRIPHKAFTPVGVRVQGLQLRFAAAWSWCASGALKQARFDCAGSLATGS